MTFYSTLIAISALTIQLNAIVFLMFVYFRARLLRNTHNRILCSMVLGDTFVGLFGINLGVLLLLGKDATYYKLLGNIPIFSSIFVSVLSLILLTVDRLIAMKKPFLYTSQFYKKLILKIIVLSWIIPCLIILQQSLIYVGIGSKTELKVRSFIFIAFFLIGVIVLVWSNAILFIGIRGYAKNLADTQLRQQKMNTENCNDYNRTDSSSREDQGYAQSNAEVLTTQDTPTSVRGPVAVEKRICPSPQPNSASYNLTKQQELKNTSLLCLLTVFLFILSWLPLASYRFCYATEIGGGIPWLRRLSLCLTIANSLINPIIYLLVRKEFRAYLKSLLFRLCCT